MSDDKVSTFSYEHPEHGAMDVPIPEGFVSSDGMTENFVPRSVHNQEMAKMRTAAKGRHTDEEMLADEDFRTRALETWEIKLDGSDPKPSPVDTEALTEKITARLRKSDVEPLTLERDGLLSEVTVLRRASLISALVQAASGIVKPSLLKSAVPGQEPPIANILGGYFGVIPDTKTWGVKEGDTFAYSSKPTNDNPFKGVAEFVLEWSGDKANADFLLDEKQRGPALNDAPKPTGGAITLTREQAQDTQQYRAASAKAIEAGVPLNIEQ